MIKIILLLHHTNELDNCIILLHHPYKYTQISAFVKVYLINYSCKSWVEKVELKKLSWKSQVEKVRVNFKTAIH